MSAFPGGSVLVQEACNLHRLKLASNSSKAAGMEALNCCLATRSEHLNQDQTIFTAGEAIFISTSLPPDLQCRQLRPWHQQAQSWMSKATTSTSYEKFLQDTIGELYTFVSDHHTNKATKDLFAILFLPTMASTLLLWSWPTGLYMQKCLQICNALSNLAAYTSSAVIQVLQNASLCPRQVGQSCHEQTPQAPAHHMHVLLTPC